MLRHWLSVTILLVPVMTFGWLLSSVFIWKLIPSLNWVDGLVLAACITATDPVLASAVVGKGKFAERVPGHLRNILSAESGCNDGMAFPFAYLSLNLIQYAGQTNQIAFHFIVITVLYECVFGCILGAVIGYCGRHLIKFAEKHNLIDRESFLVFYFVLALLCTGVGSIIGVDDLLVAFSAGAAFSWDGWFSKKTEESHVSNVIDLLLNMSFFVYFGAIVPWDQFNNASLGISPWKLVILAILVLLFRRIPIMLAMKPFIPDIRSWREALFCGHFGPIGVGAIFISILARAELEHDEPTPLASLPAPGAPNYYAIATIWPITTFLIIASIIVHGSSIAVFTLGKRLNNMTITMSYTTGGNNQTWLSRLPGIEGGRTLSLHKVDTMEPSRLQFGTGAKVKPAGGMKKRKHVKKKDNKDAPVNVPIDLMANKKLPPSEEENTEKRTDGTSPTTSSTTVRTGPHVRVEQEITVEDDGIQAYKEGSDILLEDSQGEVIAQIDTASKEAGLPPLEVSTSPKTQAPPGSSPSVSHDITSEQRPHHHHGHKVTAYQLDDNIIVENDEGEIIRRYKINRKHGDATESHRRGSMLTHGINRTLSWVGLRNAIGLHEGDEQDHHNHSPNSGETSTNHRPSVLYNKDIEKVANQDEFVLTEEAVGIRASSTDDRHIREQLGHMINSGSEGGSSSAGEDEEDEEEEEEGSGGRATPRGLPRGFLSPQRDDVEETGPSSTDAYEGETEVEKQRRLAALGLVSDDGNDDDEEYPVRKSSRDQATGVHSIAERLEERLEESPLHFSTGGIKWKDGYKK